MQGIGLSVPESGSANTMDEAREVVSRVGLPVVIRPAFILGGRGTGIASTPEEFERVATPVGDVAGVDEHSESGNCGRDLAHGLDGVHRGAGPGLEQATRRVAELAYRPIPHAVTGSRRGCGAPAW